MIVQVAYHFPFYPRPRGESFTLGIMAMMMCGLSPPTRGIRLSLALSYCGYGSTPAHAGHPD